MPRAALLALVLALSVAIPCPAAAQWQVDGVPLCTVAGDQTAPAIIRSNGGIIVVWEDSRTTPSRIFAQRLSGTGFPLWAPDGVQVATKPGDQKRPVAVSDGSAGVIVAWVQDVNGTDDVYAQRLNALGERQWALDGVVVCNAAGQQTGLAIVSDGIPAVTTLPGAIIAWTDARSGTDTDIYAQAINTSGAPRWAANGVGVCVLNWNQADVVMVTDGSSLTAFGPKGAILAWRDERDSPGVGHIYSQRLNGSGAIQWITNGVGLAPQVPEQFDPRLAFTGSASAIVVWSDGRGIDRDYELYAQRVANNAVSWGASGIRVCDVEGRKSGIAIVPDGSGGALLAWRDQRNFFNPDLYMQRFDVNGTRLWGTGAALVNGDSGSQSTPALVATEPGSALVAWVDSRSGNNDIYAQKVDANSQPLWYPAEGVPICRNGALQWEQVAVIDSTFGALIAWVDYRSGSADIYANRVGGGGQTVAVGDGPVVEFRLLPPQPHPSLGAATLHYELPALRAVTVRVFDVHGRLARTLAMGTFGAGRHTLRWDGRSDRGELVPAGVYFARLEAGGEARVQRIVLLTR